MRRAETALNAVWLVGGAAVCVHSLQLGLIGDQGPGSGLVPFAAGFIVAACGVAMLLSHGARIEPGAAFWLDAQGRGRALRLVGILVAMLLAMPYAGFTLSALVSVPLMMRAVGGCSWLYAFTVALAAALTIHLVFVTLLQTPLPRGLVGL